MEDVGPVTSGVKLTKHSTVGASYQQSGGGKVTVWGRFCFFRTWTTHRPRYWTDNPGRKKNCSRADAVGLRDRMTS